MKTIIFDFDGTLTKKSNDVWEKMWAAIDAKDIDIKLYNQYKNKQIDYIQWCKEIEKEYIKRGFNKKMLIELCDEIELMNNTEETLKILKNKGYELCIVSGGVDYAIRYILKDLASYFKNISASKFEFAKDERLVAIYPTEYDDEGKKLYIDRYCLSTGIVPSEVIFVGNGDNDEFVYLSGCKTICINPQNNTNYKDCKIWNYVIENSDDLKDILKYID